MHRNTNCLLLIIRRSVYRILGLFFLLCFLAGGSVFAKDENFAAKIVAVDVQYIFENSIAITKLKKSIDEINESIQSDAASKEAEFKKTEEKLIEEKQAESSDRKIFESKVEEFNKDVNETRKVFQARKSKLERLHSEAIGKVHVETMSIIKELSKKYGFNLAVPYSQTLYIDDKLNITLEVLEILNKKLPEITLAF